MKKILSLILISGLILNPAYLLAVAIDVGTIPGDFDSSRGYCLVSYENPANATGTIDHIDVWFTEASNEIEVASFYVVSGNNLSTRAYVTGLSGSAGDTDFDAPGDFTAFDINEGDYIGKYNNEGKVEEKATGGQGFWNNYSDQIPCTDVTFTLYGTRAVALYATGTEAGPPPAVGVQPQILILD